MNDNAVDFDKIFASAAPIERDLEEHKYLKGWAYLDEKAPEFEDFDSVMRLQDRKAQILKRAVDELRQLEEETRREVEKLQDQMGGADGFLMANNNLSDVPDKAEARKNLQLGDASVKNVGTTADTVAAGDDERFNDNGKLSGSNSWTGANLFNGSFTLCAKDGSPEGGELTFTDKDNERAFLIDVDSAGDLRVVRFGAGPNAATTIPLVIKRQENRILVVSNVNVNGEIKASGELKLGGDTVGVNGCSMSIDGNLHGPAWGGGNLKSYVDSVGGGKVGSVARGAQVTTAEFGYMQANFRSSQVVPAGCYLNGLVVGRTSTASSGFAQVVALIYRPVMIHVNGQWLQIGDIA